MEADSGELVDVLSTSSVEDRGHMESTSLIHYPRIDASPKSTTGQEDRTVREESQRGWDVLFSYQLVRHSHCNL